MTTNAAPACRVCGREITPNDRGDYVACCSPFVAPPARLSPLRTAAGTWVRALERILFPESWRGMLFARLLVSVVGTVCLVGLILVASKCAALW